MSQSVLLTLARDSIKEVLEAERIIDVKQMLKQYPLLQEKVATFVTLSINDKVRGCIGSLTPKNRLIDDVISNAKAAAFEDPRFSALTTSEYLHCCVEVSLLTPERALQYTNADHLKQLIIRGRDGVILTHGEHQAIFLPQMWKEIPDFEDFFAALCTKASLNSTCLELHPEISIFQTDSAKDTPVLK
jgi:hypothetical protein